MSNITFTCQTLRGVNKAGVLKPDEDGYWSVVLGGFNIRNERGDFYPWNKYLQDIFTRNSSSFLRRIERGHLRGERDHPERTSEYADDKLWFSRLRRIQLDRVSHHIRKVTVDFDNFKGQRGENMVAILGEVRPVAGPIGDQLLDSLRNPSEDTCFSVRTLTLDLPISMFNLQKDVYELITWDWVPEPGVRNATKYHSPGLESYEEYPVDPNLVRSIVAQAESPNLNGYGLEDNGAGDLNSLKALMADFESTADSKVLRPCSLRWK